MNPSVVKKISYMSKRYIKIPI